MRRWKTPKTQEVELKEDGTSNSCQGKAVGCYAGSSCGSVKSSKAKTEQRRPTKGK